MPFLERNSCLLVLLPLLTLPEGALAQHLAGLRSEIQSRLALDTARVGIGLADLATGDTMWLDGARRFHAASTMKLPVLIELARRIDAGELGWGDSIPVTNRFVSIADSSIYTLDLTDDSDSSLYARVGRWAEIAELAHLMIARSSNLATNLLIQRLDARRVNATAHALGADSIMVLRGVEDGPAYSRGLNNTTTARDLTMLLSAVAQGRAASEAGTSRMLSILFQQEFNEGIPAGLPPGVRVAHKTGWITGISHDAALVYPEGRPPYALVILTQGYQTADEASRLMADVSGMVYRALVETGKD